LARGTRAAHQMAGNLLANLTENPILLGAIGLTVGAMLGALVPRSEQEQAALGDVGRRARDGVSDIAREAVDRGGEVARQVVDAARETATDEGLVGKTAGYFVDEALKGNLAGSVGEVAREVLKAGEKAIREDGLRQGEHEQTSETETKTPPPLSPSGPA